MKAEALRHAQKINDSIMNIMEDINDLGIEIAYNGSLDGAPDWIDDILAALETASDILEDNMGDSEGTEYGEY